jgi:uncharacterized protein
MKRLLFIAMAFALSAGTAFAYANPGNPTGFVNDFAGALSPSDKAALESKLSAYEKSSGNEITVAVIKSLDGDYIENFAEKLFQEWGIGKEKQDNGALLLIAMDDRELRIEVGYGLEPYLTDAASSIIIRETITPAFKEGEYARGISEGVDRMIDAASGSPVVSSSQGGMESDSRSYFGLFVLVAILAQVLGRKKLWWIPPPIVFLASWALLGSLAAAGAIALFTLFFSFLASKVPHDPKGGGGIFWGGGGFGGGRSGGSSFGGFGGGSSGGGGASGKW